jgi:hypothetical protein
VVHNYLDKTSGDRPKIMVQRAYEAVHGPRLAPTEENSAQDAINRYFVLKRHNAIIIMPQTLLEISRNNLNDISILMADALKICQTLIAANVWEAQQNGHYMLSMPLET